MRAWTFVTRSWAFATASPAAGAAGGGGDAAPDLVPHTVLRFSAGGENIFFRYIARLIRTLLEMCRNTSDTRQ